MIPETTREAIEKSLKRFDSEYRHSEGWQNWESNKAQKYAIKYEGAIYPPKKIISLAANVPVNSFSGGLESNDYLKKYGFEIITLIDETSDSTSTVGIPIAESFQSLLETYLEARRSNVYGKKSPIWPIFKNAEKSIKTCTAVSLRDHLKVYGSTGQGRWTAVPWIGIFDDRITTTSREGLNCGFLFCADMSGVYIALNQGVTKLVEEYGRSEGRSVLEEKKGIIRKKFEQLEEVGFRLDNSIDLKTDVTLSQDYEVGVIAYKFYAKDNLPSDSEINEDLDALLTLYQDTKDSFLESSANYWIFQANPKYFDIDNALMELNKIHWSVKQYTKQIKKNDRVFFWKAGQGAGVIAYGIIETDPGYLTVPVEEEKYDIQPEKYEAQLKVRVKLKKRFTPPIEKSRILEADELKTLSIIKQPAGTNFTVTDKQASLLLELLDEYYSSEQEVDLSHERKRKKNVWLVSPGRNAEFWDEFYREGIIAIGWDGTEDLQQYDTIQNLTDHLIDVFEPETQPRNDARACFDFAHTVEVGDLIFVKKGRKSIVGYGYITGEYQYDKERAYYHHVRTVRWEERGSWKYEGGLPIKTITEISSYTTFVEDLKVLVGLLQPDEDDEVSPVEERQPYTKEEAYKDLFLPTQEFDSIVDFWSNKKNLILQGPPGVGKTFIAKRLAYTLMGYKDPSRLGMIQFHQSYSYEDFVQGYRPVADGFALKNGLFYEFCKKAKRDQDNTYVFIVDEINRGNLSKIFGELLMLLECDKRGPEWSVPLTYSESLDQQFYIPNNLYILGMMNTADRSLSMVDYALRRRFGFITLDSQVGSKSFSEFLVNKGVEEDLINTIVKGIGELNNEIESDVVNLGAGFSIGHSFFCPNGEVSPNKNWYKSIIKHEILPLLNEYWFDDTNEKLTLWGNKLLQD